MSTEAEVSNPPSGAAKAQLGLLWAASAVVAGFGAWVLFEALPGINWVLWTGAAVAGLLGFSRARGAAPRSVAIVGGVAVVVAGAAAVTASPVLWVLICLLVVFLLAVAMLLATGLSLRSVTAWFAATAPLAAFQLAVVETMRRAAEATQRIRSTRARAWVRGLAMTVPVLVVFALLFAGADPVFAAWRDAVEDLVASWAFVPRVAFFGLLLVIVLGAYGYASVAAKGPVAGAPTRTRWLGSTERLILLAGVAGLLWLFLAVQVGYLFGNLPRIPASGMTFAEYARRGFGELSAVASASAALIVVSERYGEDHGRRRTLALLTFAVMAAVLLLVASALRRMWLYEEAYGFTTARLYARVYMYAVGAGLVLLSLEVARGFDAGRLFRRAAATALLLFIGLTYWNHEAWIASRNLDRFATTGTLDVAYLTRELSADAIPAIGERLPSLPDSVRSEVSRAVRERYAAGPESRRRAWFEWSVSGSRARRALATSFASF